MNHSLIPQLKFHPEQHWPHREKEGYWGLTETRALETRLTRVDPASHGAVGEMTALFHHDSPLTPLPPFLLSLTGELGTTIHCLQQKMSACSQRSVMRGLTEPRGVEMVNDALSFFSLWPNAGKEWGLMLDCSPLQPHTQISKFRYLLYPLHWNQCLYKNSLSPW